MTDKPIYISLDVGDMGFMLLSRAVDKMGVARSTWYVEIGPSELWICRARMAEIHKANVEARIVRFVVLSPEPEAVDTGEDDG